MVFSLLWSVFGEVNMSELLPVKRKSTRSLCFMMLMFFYLDIW
jgi:hypothetical protein